MRAVQTLRGRNVSAIMRLRRLARNLRKAILVFLPHMRRQNCRRMNSVRLRSKRQKMAAFTRKFLAGADREYLLALSIDNAGKLAAIEVVSIGTVNATLAEPREIFKHAILANAAGIVMVHNHTSGRCVPSEEDMATTKRIEKAGKILGIPLMDHIIVGDGYFSFQTEGLLAEGNGK